MTTTSRTAPSASSAANRSPAVVNDFSIHVATINGSGSQTSNNVLMRTIFQMGVPVSGKNLFPSNIQGLPTWFTIRASKHGWIARRKDVDVLVCMNPETAKEDVLALQPGRVVVYDAPLKLDKLRSDLVFFEIPFAKIVAGVPDVDGKIKRLLANMAYVGVLAELLGLDLAESEKALRKHFKGKEKPVAINLKALDLGAKYVREHFPDAKVPFRIERMNATQGKIIVDGNMAAAVGCLMAGCSAVAWYPITPSSSLVESLIELFRKYRRDPKTGKATYAVVQAEDELASIGMVLAAGWCGCRAMTSTSGPGVSLMGEFAGFGYYAEIPAVIVDVQRTGPSTGLPTRTQQADLLQVAFLSHGDTKHVAVIPGNVEECYTLTLEAFDLAERLQTPVFVLTDLDLGMNNWMADPFPYPGKAFDRGKVLGDAELKKMAEQGRKFFRYVDADGDGVPYRTLPGSAAEGAAYFTRGSGHNEKGQYTERPEEYAKVMDRLARKYEGARDLVPMPVVSGSPHSEVGLIAFGSSHAAVEEALAMLRERDVHAAYLRLRAIPFHQSVREFVALHPRCYVVEQNRDAQMLKLLKTDLPSELCTHLRSILHYDGLPIDAQFIVNEILEQERLPKRKTPERGPGVSGVD